MYYVIPIMYKQSGNPDPGLADESKKPKALRGHPGKGNNVYHVILNTIIRVGLEMNLICCVVSYKFLGY
jgi:hypothetical protein